MNEINVIKIMLETIPHLQKNSKRCAILILVKEIVDHLLKIMIVSLKTGG
jgi:hypothetical protein